MSFLKSLTEENGSVIITKFNAEKLELKFSELSDDQICKICFLDVETTGKNRQEDGIVELAMKVVSIDKNTGVPIEINHQYESFNDPGIPISEEASMVNGITDNMVRGKSIDYDYVRLLFEFSDLIVAHYANFDRAFLDNALPLSREKLWACSINDIGWLARGFKSNAQELLCIWHGFYYESHRAMNDVDALIHLLTHKSYRENKPVLEMIDNAFIPYYKIAAVDSPYETKDVLKSHNYYWDNVNRYWWKRLTLDEIEPEKEWLMKNVYNTDHFLGTINEIPIIDKYKE